MEGRNEGEDERVLEASEETTEDSEQQKSTGRVVSFPLAALLTEAGLAEAFGKHPCSIRRAVTRGELPKSVRVMGKPTWTWAAIIQHTTERLEAAAKEAEILAEHLP